MNGLVSTSGKKTIRNIAGVHAGSVEFMEAHRLPAAGDATTAFLAGRQRTLEGCQDAEQRLPGPDDAVECAGVLEAIAEAAV